MKSLLDYRSDFPAYAADLLWIVSARRQLIPFRLNTAQMKVHSAFQPLVEKGRVFMYILKARQTGISTYAEGRIFHSAHLWHHTRAGVVADEVDRAEQIFKMTQLFYERLPAQYRPMTRHSNRRELIFENPSKYGRFINPGLGSSIEVFTAGNANTGRGFTFNIAHLSEWAFYPNGADFVDALIPTIHNVPGNFVIFETTPDMAGSFAHYEWKRYKKVYSAARSDGKHCELLPIFLPWWEFPEYAVPLPSDEALKELLNTLDDEEKSLIGRFKLTPEQLYWRRTQIDLMKGDVEAFRKEYPSDDEECWLVAGLPLFSRTVLNKAWSALPESIWRGEITPTGDLVKSDTGRFSVFKTPDKSRKYVMGVDPSGGSSDEAVIQVIDAATLEQCAEWVGVVNGIDLASYIYPIGVMYGGLEGLALLAIELNGGWGLTTQTELIDKYWNMYRWLKYDVPGTPPTEKLGWVTSVRTKPLLIDFGQYCFENGYAQVNSPELLREMSTFIRTECSAEARSGASDNRVMAWLIALYVAGSGRTDIIAHNKALLTEKKLDKHIEFDKLIRKAHLHATTGLYDYYEPPATDLSFTEY